MDLANLFRSSVARIMWPGPWELPIGLKVPRGPRKRQVRTHKGNMSLEGGCDSPADMKKTLLDINNGRDREAGFPGHPGKARPSQLNKAPNQKVLKHAK